MIYVIGATAIRFAVDNWNEHKKAKELEREKTQAELNFLKAQVNPHFLFNAFNSLYALSLKSDNRLPEAILHLSELMRYVLDYSQKETALLQEEIEMIENYIDIQKIRLDDQFDLRFHQKGNTSDVQVTPLVLLPIIENCFKHSDLSTDGFIYFNLIVKDNRIFFTAQNKIETSNNGNASGLKNLEKRLQLRYNHDYLLETNSDGETYTTSLELPAYDA